MIQKAEEPWRLKGLKGRGALEAQGFKRPRSLGG